MTMLAPALSEAGGASLLGLLIGSFANVCIHRIPLSESVVTPRSRCPSCRQPISAWDNVPLLSWLWLGGRCRSCRARISVRYPLVELTNGAMYGLIAWVHGLTARSVTEMAFVTALLILGLIDLDHRILPDIITLPGVLAGLCASLMDGPPTLQESALSASGIYLLFAVVATAYKRVRGVEGLGQGDWKMAAMMGAFLGWQETLFAVFAGASLGSVMGMLMMAFAGKDARYALPFGTFLGLGGVAAVLGGGPAVAWYRALIAR